MRAEVAGPHERAKRPNETSTRPVEETSVWIGVKRRKTGEGFSAFRPHTPIAVACDHSDASSARMRRRAIETVFCQYADIQDLRLMIDTRPRLSMRSPLRGKSERDSAPISSAAALLGSAWGTPTPSSFSEVIWPAKK